MPRRLPLIDGEAVVLDVAPHWWKLMGPAAVLVATIAGAIAALAYAVPTVLRWLTIVVLAAALAWMSVRYLRWRHTRLIVTTWRVVERKGVFGRWGQEIRLSAITDIACRQRLWERVIGAGDLLVEVAGRDGRLVFADLTRPGEVSRQMWGLIERPGGVAAPATGPVPSAEERLEQLDRLHRRGLISDAEFQTKRAEVLGRL